jgi:hypothetical protein
MGSSGDYFRIQANGNTIVFNNDAGSITLDITSNPLIENAWNHIAFTRDSSDNVKWYTNGILAASGSRSGTVDYNYIGSKVDPSGPTREGYFGGNMAQIGIWERALSVSEIQNIVYKTYDDLKGTEKTHLLHWYPLDSDVDSEGVTNTYKDSHGTNHGANSGSTLKDDVYADYSPKKPRGFDNAPTAQADLIGSGSALFASGEYIEVGDVGTVKTLTFWFKPTAQIASGTSAKSLFWFKDDASNKYYGVHTGASTGVLSGEVLAVLPDNSTRSGTNTTLEAGVWHHFAIVWDESNGSAKHYAIYTDGALTTDLQSGNHTRYDWDSFRIGKDGGFYDTTVGNIAQVGIWSTSISQEQIQSIKEKTYSELTTSEKTNLTSWWGLDSSLTGQNQSIVLDENDTTTTSISLNGNESTLANVTGTYTANITADLTIGKTYKLIFTKAETVNSGYDQWRLGITANVIYATSALGAGTYTLYFQATVAEPLNWQSGGGTPWQGSITNISLEEYDGNPGVLI